MTSQLRIATHHRHHPIVEPARSRIHEGSRAAAHDPRWPAIAAALMALRDRRRRAIRIVDAECGAGCLLLHTLRHARALGFTAIEGRGIGGSPALIGRARANAGRLADPAIGVVFEVADLVAALREERDFPADIVIWHGTTRGEVRAEVMDAVACAGRTLIGDVMPGCVAGVAA